MALVLTIIFAVLIGWLSTWSYNKYIAHDCACGK